MDFNVDSLIKAINKGEVVIPDFQREFVWEPEAVRELIVSVLGDYFIGSMVILENFREDECPFKLRLIYGVKDINKDAKVQSTVHVLLDGQQRATALFYASKQPDRPLKERRNPYKFFIDIEKALNKKWGAAVISVNQADKQGMNKVQSNPNIIPLSSFADIVQLTKNYVGHPKINEILDLARDFSQRPIHVVSLSIKTSPDKIVETFERANRFGKPLTTFELLTARLRKWDIDLPQLWQDAKKKYIVAKFIKPEFVLRVIALQRGEATKPKALLDLEPEKFMDDWGRACEMLNVAYARITDTKHGYGVFNFRKWLPYKPMIVPLASIIDFLRSNNLEKPKNYNKIARWYWVAVFSNRYDEGAMTKQETDFKDLKEWILDDNEVPDFIQEFKPITVDLNVEKQNAAIYRGVIDLIVLEGALDFATGQPLQFDKEKVQDDHVFPKSIYNEHRIFNRTLLTTNVKKSNAQPSTYFKRMLLNHGEPTFKKILASHIIPPECHKSLFENNIQEFLKIRRKAIIKRIKQKVESKS
jgi:hypothetical protein